MSRYKISQDHQDMVPSPAGVAIPRTIWQGEDGILQCYGITMPVDGSAGYAIGCLFQHTDGTDGSALYVNEGTALSCDFNLVTVAAA